MKLDSPKVGLPNDRCKFGSVLGRGQRVVGTQWRGETVDEVKRIVMSQAFEQGIVSPRCRRIPAHVGYRKVGTGGECFDPPRDQA